MKHHKEIIHNTEKTRHERSECSSFYGSLVVIMFLIVATAVVLQRFGSDGFGKGDVTGMAVESNPFIFENVYEIVYVGDEPYARWSSADGTVYYTDKNAIMYTPNNDGVLTKVGEDVFLRDSSISQIIPAFQKALKESENALTNFKWGRGGVSYTEEYEGAMHNFASENQYNYEDVLGEYTAINTYLNTLNDQLTYDVITDYYSGTTKDGIYIFHDENGNTGTSVPVNGQQINILKEKGTLLGKPTYYQCTEIIEGICTAKTKYSGDTSGFSDAITNAKKADEDIQEDIQKQMKICEKQDNNCQLTYGEITNKHYLSATARQDAFMNRLYAEQEAKVQGLIAGWLNGYIDELLGGWSRGVPAGICAHIFGLEYYKQDGWTRVPMNASVDQLQSTLITNSRTVIIEGEKEEITEDMFRYAYTIKLLANQSVEWQTYLYNSCTGETSVDTFYDYGSLAAAGYYAFHYAGAGTQDMIFACEEEICLYDQACVVFADGTAPTCVSLVHGAGFETPVAGNDYDCAITG